MDDVRGDVMKETFRGKDPGGPIRVELARHFMTQAQQVFALAFHKLRSEGVPTRALSSREPLPVMYLPTREQLAYEKRCPPNLYHRAFGPRTGMAKFVTRTGHFFMHSKIHEYGLEDSQLAVFRLIEPPRHASKSYYPAEQFDWFDLHDAIELQARFISRRISGVRDLEEIGDIRSLFMNSRESGEVCWRFIVNTTDNLAYVAWEAGSIPRESYMPAGGERVLVPLLPGRSLGIDEVRIEPLTEYVARMVAQRIDEHRAQP